MKLSSGAFGGSVENPLNLATPRATGHYTAVTDACDKKIGCMLLQEESDGPVSPIEYWSRMLSEKKRRLVTTRRGCLAVVLVVLLLRLYLEGNWFTERTH